MPQDSTSRKLGRWSVIAVILGNGAAMIGSIEDVYSFFRNLLGVDWLSLGLFVFAVTIALGFVLGCLWIYRRFLIGLSLGRRIWLTAVLAVVGATAVYGNIVLLSNHQPFELVLAGRIQAWGDRLIKCQTPNGGVRVNHRDPEAPPQAWTTAQALTGFLATKAALTDEETRFVDLAFGYIESVRRSGEEEGWGYFPFYERSVTEIGAWVVLAYTHSLRVDNCWSDRERIEVEARVERDLAMLVRRQHGDGGWGPTKEVSVEFTRTYSTLMAVWSLAEARENGLGRAYERQLDNGIQWLLNTWNNGTGWVPNPHRDNQIHHYAALTAHVLYVLARAERQNPTLVHDRIYRRARESFLHRAETASREATQDDHLSDMDQYLFPTDFQIEGSTFLWFPWALASLTETSVSAHLDAPIRDLAEEQRTELLKKGDQLLEYMDSGPTYVVAENLFSLAISLRE